MTYEQNVKAVLETYFIGSKDEIIDSASKRICELETNGVIEHIIGTVSHYNGYDDLLREWANLEGVTDESVLFRPDYKCDDREAAQIEIIWMMLVVMFGDWGTSPRYGWIENISEFRNFVQQITEV